MISSHPEERNSQGPPGPSEQRGHWEVEWSRRRASEFGWYLAEPPPELRLLEESRELPQGLALDVGCGSGVVTNYLGRHLERVVGLDVAIGALMQAREANGTVGGKVSYLVAEAPRIPFKDGTFTFVFDRGCLHHVPPSEWPDYFEAVCRLLRPGGLFQLYCARLGRINRIPVPVVRTLIRRFLRNEAPLESLLPDLAAPTLKTLAVQKIRYPLGRKHVDMVYVLFRREP
ncbi:MAG: class I SAM-dependent methyltransferase [Actinomycetota bacterium]